MLLDVESGSCLRSPDASAMEEAFEAQAWPCPEAPRRLCCAARLSRRSPRTASAITLMVNAGLRDDVAALDMTGADGIGLFRTEFQFLVSATMPQRERQQRLYRECMDAAGDRPVIFRTVDIGGDKALPYLRDDR